MFKNFSEAQHYVQQNQIKMIDLKFCDLWGRWHHVTITKREFTPDLMSAGVGFDGSSVGFKSVASGDMALIPDLSTGFVDPFWEIRTLSFICHIVEADTKRQFTGEPREIARKAEDFLKQTKIADSSLWGPEFEFYLFNQVLFESNPNAASYTLDSNEALWNSHQARHGHLIAPHGGYHAIPPKDQNFRLRAKMVETLEDLGVPVKYHHHEVGGPGQHEIETPLMGILQAGDAALIIKYVTKMIAHDAGQSVTFMPKPLFGEAGSGMHFHQQLFKQNSNLFYDAENANRLSQTALYYIGGLLHHAPAVLAFTNPTTNSYRRLIPGFEAPINAFFSMGNRSAAIRIPKYATEADHVRFEFRPPDATCNPYLAMAAMLMAGIDGIRNKIDPTLHGFGPINEDVFSWPEEKRAMIKSLPTSLEEALTALTHDQQFLMEHEVFPKALIDHWIRTKKQEIQEVQTRPHPHEFIMYYDL